MARTAFAPRPRTRPLAYTAAALTLACAGQVAAAPLADRPHGNAMGDGLQSLDGGPQEPLFKEVCAAGATTFGIDVSYYQGDIDWGAVAGAGVKFAWVRASHSTQFEDPQFPANLSGGRAAGVHIGAYQYFEPQQDPIAQAQLLLDMMGPLQPGDLPPMLDVESKDLVPQAQYVEAIRAWLDHVEAATGVAPFIYTGYYYWKDNVGPTDEFVDHPLVIANYNPTCPLVPDAWPTWTVHQYCDCGSVAGIDGPVDVDEFNGDEATLMGYAVGGSECGDDNCTLGEDAYNCPADCPPCGVIGPEGGTIDNGAACLELLGDLKYWRDEAVGEGGSLVWTNVTDYADPANAAIWRLFFAEAGVYSLATWVEPPFGETKQSKYVVHHAGGETVVPIDQSAVSGWVELGEFSFSAATDHYVRIDDNTGESPDLELSLVADALRITRVDAGPESSGGPTSDGPETGGTGDGESATGAAPTSGGAAEESGTPEAESSSSGPGGGGGALPSDYGAEDGCGCNQAPRGGALWVMLAALLVRRRRAA